MPGGGGGGPTDTANMQAQAEAAKAAEEKEANERAKAEGRFDGDLNPKSEFNVGNNAATQEGYYGNGPLNPAIAAIKGAAGQQRTVANNTGGQIPGSGGDSQGAKLNNGRGGSPGSPGYTTDVLQGFQGGGGGGTGGGSTETKDDGEGFKGYGGRNVASEPQLDLRQYLPGGSRDPGVKLGGFRPFSVEINGPHVNVWSRITLRMLEKCRLGQLIDCR
jgi:hypothetical protein